MTWRDEAACQGQDPNLFFPGQGGATLPARRICHDCPVQRECLSDALRHDYPNPNWNYGIRGGLGPLERARLVRNRRKRIA